MDRAAPRVQPSEFLRGFRPEYYSDTKKRPDYSLTASSLEYCLETITARNQTHDFEIFCRKLCERAICPNLRPQTGPDGGGDSKADTETFAVADEISNLTYISEANSGNEKWAFAFSAKARWAQKVRDDVAGLISTGRNYDRIICVTSRFAKAKTRAALEDELSQKHSIPITIHDRSWIVNETIAKDRTDLAFNYLKVGNPPSNDARLGPKDYSRSQQLVDIEKAIDDPDAFKGMELQLVSEALVAAKLSRSLERPRTETDGRFARAVRVANKHGVFRQKLEARYEQIRTAFWWFDDFSYLNETYSEFESLAINSDHSKNLELLGNVNQLLFVSIIHGHLSPEECAITDRTDRLIQALTKCAKDTTRPNNSLEAEAALLRCELNKATAFGTPDALPTIWQKFSEVLKKAKGLTSQNYLDLSHWEKIAKKSYPNRNRNILIPRIHLKTKLKPQRPSSEEGNDFEASNHRDVNIKSVIDVHAWEKAKWRGCGYLTTAGSTIPFMAFLFEDQPVAEIIFERWITRFGQKDADDEILISIVTDLPNESPHHYCVQVASNPTNIKNGKPTVVGTRSMTMTPPNGDNLARFLSAYRRVGSYCLIPGSGLLTPSFSFNLAIEKQKLAIKRASEVNANDIEAASLRTRGIKLASDA